MNLSVGIVGFPNAGKSTLFNALLGRQIAATAAYPFCTIEPNVGVVAVPDERLAGLAKIVKPEKVTPAVVKFIDIAGLVKGAHKGEGLGNQFLAHIREVDAICFVLRAFENKEVDLAGSTEPKQDLANLKAELILKDLETIEKAKYYKEKIKDIKEKQSRELKIKKLVGVMNQGKMLKDIDLTEEEQELANQLNLLTLKPYFVVLNVNEQDLSSLEKIVNDYQDWMVIPICAKLEEELTSLSTEEQKEYLRSLGLQKPGLERLITVAYEHLGLISFLTANPKEARAWTVKEGILAPQAAGIVHSDFEKGFIKAEVINCQKLIEIGSWQKAKEKGLLQLEGKDYKIKDGDVIQFKFN